MIIYDDDGIGYDVIPRKVIDDIRAEINRLTYYWCEIHPRSVIDDVLEIIDKHIGEGSKE